MKATGCSWHVLPCRDLGDEAIEAGMPFDEAIQRVCEWGIQSQEGVQPFGCDLEIVGQHALPSQRLIRVPSQAFVSPHASRAAASHINIRRPQRIARMLQVGADC